MYLGLLDPFFRGKRKNLPGRRGPESVLKNGFRKKKLKVFFWPASPGQIFSFATEKWCQKL